MVPPLAHASGYDFSAERKRANCYQLLPYLNVTTIDQPMSSVHSSNTTSSKALPVNVVSPLDRLIGQLVEQVLDHWNRYRRLGATYRVQLHASGFRLPDAHGIVDYLKDLGITHLYCSPLTKAQSGSMHGYDVVDPTQLNDELGSEQDLSQLIDALHAAGIETLLDIVPNHMSVASDQNRWWLDVLKHGPASPFAMFFDIDWYPSKSELQGRILLPVLSAVSGEVLEAGQLAVRYCEGEFCLECDSYRLPLDPKTCGRLLSANLPELSGASHTAEAAEWLELRSIIAAMEHLPDRHEDSLTRLAERQRESFVIQRRLNELVGKRDAIADHVRRNLLEFNGVAGQPHSFDQLDELLNQQAYRLVHWKASSDEINYRRFFDVTSLAALCVERLHVFQHTHQRILQWAASGWISALRVDHVDGLFDPVQYLWRLQWGYMITCGRQAFEALPNREQVDKEWNDIEPAFLSGLHEVLGGADPVRLFSPHELQRDAAPLAAEHLPAAQFRGGLPLPVYVEKILGADEPLPDEWPVLGTTGYDFLNAINGLFVHPDGLEELTRQYGRFVLDVPKLDDLIYECKRLILSGPMRSEVTLLATRLDRLAHRSRYWRDFTLNALEFALQETIACFAVYRTYIRDSVVSARDAQVVQRAVAMAKRRNPAVEIEAFDFLRDVLLLVEPRDLSDEDWRDREYLVGRFQQVTSPVQAKGVEDTTFYRYIPLLSVDEVGNDLKLAVKSADQYHRQNVDRQMHWPLSMLATTTHDTKRTEDVRARINVLSEVPALWRKSLQRWYRLNRKFLREVDGLEAPSRNDQWLFYQTLVGIWPVSPPSQNERMQLISRVQQYLEKATKEAKIRTSWISPNSAYDAAVRHFVEAVMAANNGKFAADFQEFVDSVLDAGLITAAAQVLLKLTAPGVPDIYQGQELWDFSLVDPDNRRAVDYDLRRHLLREVRHETRSMESRAGFAQYLAKNPRDNRFKLWTTVEGLACRRRLLEAMAVPPDKMAASSDNRCDLVYEPLAVDGALSQHVIAHAWRQRSTDQLQFVVAVPRFTQTLAKPLLDVDWQDTCLILPRCDRPLTHRFTGRTIALTESLPVKELFHHFPLALLS